MRKRRTNQRAYGRARPKKRGEMNELEQRHFIETINGRYDWWAYEAWSFALNDNGKRIVYTPDFVLLRPDGEIEVHEVKGGQWLGDSRLRFKLAADKYPMFHWRAFVYRGKRPPEVEEL